MTNSTVTTRVTKGYGSLRVWVNSWPSPVAKPKPAKPEKEQKS